MINPVLTFRMIFYKTKHPTRTVVFNWLLVTFKCLGIWKTMQVDDFYGLSFFTISKKFLFIAKMSILVTESDNKKVLKDCRTSLVTGQ